MKKSVKTSVNNDLQLSDEEKILIEKLRLNVDLRNRITKELKEKEREEELKSKAATLEENFKAAVREAKPQIQICLNIADQAIKDAKSIAETYGVPFQSEIDGMPRERTYTPRSFDYKWSSLNKDVLWELDLYCTSDEGWQYWNTSGLTC